MSNDPLPIIGVLIAIAGIAVGPLYYWVRSLSKRLDSTLDRVTRLEEKEKRPKTIRGLASIGEKEITITPYSENVPPASS